MSLGEPIIMVFCDRNTTDECEREIECSMTALARNSWDARNVESEIRRYGWTTDGDQHWCSECADQDKE